MPKFFKIKKPEKSSIKWAGSSDLLRQPLDLSRAVTRRLQIFMVVICLLFSVVWVRLYQIQVLSQKQYAEKLAQYIKKYQTFTTPRGEILDRNGNVLVANRERLAITYMRPYGTTNDQEWDMCYRFVDLFEIDASGLKQRDLKDLFITLYPDLATAKITVDDWKQYNNGVLSDNDIYLLKIERINAEDLQKLDERTKRAYIVKSAIDAPPSGTVKIVKNDITLLEAAYLTEHSDQFPGIDIAINWGRDYPYGNLLASLLGTITTPKQGLPAEKLLYYLALDYDRNDVLGRSGLELEYEDLLKGNRSVYDISYDKDTGLGKLIEIEAGSKGQDLITSIDVELQLQVEAIIAATMNREKKNPYRKYMNKIYITVMKPSTGDILAIAGMTRGTTSIYNDPVSVYTDAVIPGSIVKGATLYMGLSEGVVRPGEIIFDTPIKIMDTPAKSSWKNLGNVTDLQALSMSSNVYMFNIAMRLGGAKYVYNGPLNVDVSAFDTMRYYYNQFGLGLLTGIDASNEAVGYIGSSKMGGHLLDFAIGQYDTYTTMQLAQYVSTIANEGIRVKPRLVTSAVLANTDIVSYQNDVTVLNVLENKAALKRIQMGFRLCVTDGLCRSHINNLPVAVAAKTGTAQNFFITDKGEFVSTPNSNMIAYAPYDKPQIAIACSVPNAWNDKSQLNICQEIVGNILATYFKK
ncbi:MAG: penicillin-binding protein 2 [Erysipelotrichales bacterium]|nr:MAG: penicillin-binding protein 2 [Erysipelotrichales bacterium]